MAVTRVGCYERVSTEEQALRGFSIETQIDNLTEHCRDNNMEIVDHYTDEGVSGGKPAFKRPAMARLLEDVKAGKIDMILFTKLDRWFRNVQEYFKVQEILDEHKVEWKTIHEDYDTTTANGRMAITIFLAIAQNEREKTAERIKVVLEHKRKNREACFGGQAVPWGYTKEKDEGGLARLVKDPETQQACQEFWDIIVKTHNLNAGIRHMSNVYGITKNWKSWSRLVLSDFYCGEHRGVEEYCDPYVTKENWLKYQESRPIKATPSGRVYLFRGLIRCECCGQKLCGDGNKKSYGVYKSYRCVNRHRGCDHPSSTSEKRIEKQLLADMEYYLRKEIARVELEQKAPKPKPKTDVKALKEKLRRLTVAYRAGNISDDEYLRDDAELKALIKKAEADATEPPKDVTPLKELLETDFRGLYATFDEEEKQRFWLGLIKEIVLDGTAIKDVKFF